MCQQVLPLRIQLSLGLQQLLLPRCGQPGRCLLPLLHHLATLLLVPCG
jgi:hypothetical protein